MRGLLANRNFLIYVTGQAVSKFGDNLFPVAVLISVIQVTRSPSAGALVLAAETVPMILLTLFGGVIGDRFARNKIMLAADLLRAATQFVMAALLLHGGTPLWAFMATQFFYGLGAPFFEPAATGILPQVVESEQIPKANALISSLAGTAQIIGPIVAGALILTGGAAVAVGFDGFTFLVSAATLALLRLPASQASFSNRPIFMMIKDGWTEFTGAPWLVVTIVYIASLVIMFNAPVMSLAPAVSLSRMHGPSSWALMLSAFGAGSIFGSFVVGKFFRSLPLWAVYAGMLGTVPFLLTLAMGRWSIAIPLTAAFAGIAISIFSATWRSKMQMAIRPAFLSRVGAYLWLATVAMMPVGLAIAGPLAARFGTSVIFTTSAAWMFAASIVAGALCAPLERRWFRDDRSGDAAAAASGNTR